MQSFSLTELISRGQEFRDELMFLTVDASGAVDGVCSLCRDLISVHEVCLSAGSVSTEIKRKQKTDQRGRQEQDAHKYDKKNKL